jgi:hypothetical protein
MHLGKRLLAVAVVAALLGAPQRSRANTYATTAVATTVATTAGVVALIYFLVIKKDDKNATPPPPGTTTPPPNPNGNENVPPPPPPNIPPPPNTPAAELYLKQNSLELAEDLATGEGQVIDDLAAGLAIPANHRGALSKLLRAHRAELLELARPDKLTEARSVAFLQLYVDLVSHDPVLSSDYQRYLVSVGESA